MEVKHALDELVSLVGEGDNLQKSIETIQARLDSELSAKKKIEHDYHISLAQYYAADQHMLTMKATHPTTKAATTTAEVPSPASTIPGLRSISKF